MKFAKCAFTMVLWVLAACGRAGAESPATGDQAIAATQNAAAMSTASETPGPEATATRLSSPTPIAPPTQMGGSGLLAFSSNRNERYQIFAMKADGANQGQIVESDIDSYDPEFAPDGSVLLLWVEDPSATPALHGIRFWFGEVGLSEIFPFLSGTWSPDGQKIAATFVQEGAQDTDIGIIDIDGGGFTPLTSDLADDEHPDWCGESILFTRTVEETPYLYLMDADGGNQRALEFEGKPLKGRLGDWSPDCSRIAFVFGDGNGTQIYVVDVDGRHLQQLTYVPGFNEDPVWSPDGALIAFWSDRTGDREIYLMHADGSSQVNLTNSPGADQNPTWVP